MKRDEKEEVMTTREKLAETPGEGFLEDLARRLGVTVNAANVYGQPIERDGVTVIPVAKAMYGLGGGIGKKESESGSGGGGGVILSPVGFIEMTAAGTRFRPIWEPRTTVALVAAGGLLALLALRTVAAMTRR
jgi:uncharacterized spore protein YtfJ